MKPSPLEEILLMHLNNYGEFEDMDDFDENMPSPCVSVAVLAALNDAYLKGLREAVPLPKPEQEDKLNLTTIEKSIDRMLEGETEESLNKWLEEQEEDQDKLWKDFEKLTGNILFKHDIEKLKSKYIIKRR